MPYTPPSHRSPASSASTSPNVSRRSSLQTGTRPSLPRSASYLLKHRRTPSASAVSDGSTGTLTPQGTSEDLKSMVSNLSSAVRQSPPPVTDDRTMPMGAIISPPDSASSGSDDEGTLKIRGRKLEKLRDAASQIPQQRTPSPERNHADRSDSANRNGVHFSFSTSALGDLGKPGRRMGHVRSATEPHAQVAKSADNSLTASDEESDDDLRKKPQMVRKKSGELVRPALRPPSRRRPSSMPGTPIFSKAVHFDSHLEHVRHFLQVDRPLAVSAGSSPVENYDSDTEYPFPSEDKTRSPPFEWEILTSNFPQDSPARKALPVRLEKVWLSADQKTLHGSIAISNLAFQKAVTCRFTLDYWKTTSEVAAEFGHEIRPRETPLGHDRFTFSIKLADTANLESKTLFFCIRYAVNGREYWDNNDSRNFQVDFRKKHLAQNGKNNFQGASGRSHNGLPRSNRRGANVPRPKSMPSFGEFENDAKFLDQPIHEYLGESASGSTGLRLKTKSTSNLASDNMSNGLGSPSGLAFANRYDFGASLNAAVKAAKDTVNKDKDGLYMKANVRSAKPAPPVPSAPLPLATPSTQKAPSPSAASTPTLPSSSYEELVNKYCFFGSKQSSPTLRDGTMNSGRFDGTSGDHAGRATRSLTTSPQIYQHAGSATHHTLQLGSSGSVFRPITYNPSSIVLPTRDITLVKAASNPSTPRTSAAAAAAATSFTTFDGTPPSDTSYPLSMDRFPWAGDAHAATAIRG
ncbi:putative phosphatase regulatory subunit-domain-containing protein [Ilyonectria robusta]|uniref:putative phosphatase regulatory subunit-domain-containing protein n=1 Tax=Ilyonectria robusta TaxID=1079257 RepID=UPI001E8EDEBA|nr:putative phosphatase regulatory subunit-domain-containing protein [Ilyonectria robusta]KAH8738324.1 putative phosphatase regulatory subunit-domain-containing protein [Ilyonectria robusta]